MASLLSHDMTPRDTKDYYGPRPVRENHNDNSLILERIRITEPITHSRGKHESI